MKRIIFLAIACVLFNIAYAQENNEKVQNSDTTAVFSKTIHDFGNISESGGILECEFPVTNTGNKPLVITKVSTSCGCTASEWSKEPIDTGKQGFIKVTFNPKGRSGEINKSLTVLTNGNPSNIRLKIKGNIEKQPVAQK
ncbi:MAG: DUF1573 domain-containing protein [Tannerella sp.]|jgi:hypothetical protein|nr:DUF1573 domain-containing protein [Tannerella sp.]